MQRDALKCSGQHFSTCNLHTMLQIKSFPRDSRKYKIWKVFLNLLLLLVPPMEALKSNFSRFFNKQNLYQDRIFLNFPRSKLKCSGKNGKNLIRLIPVNCNLNSMTYLFT